MSEPTDPALWERHERLRQHDRYPCCTCNGTHCCCMCPEASQEPDSPPDPGTRYVAPLFHDGYNVGQVLVVIWADGSAEYATRPHPSATWGRPTPLIKEE